MVRAGRILAFIAVSFLIIPFGCDQGQSMTVEDPEERLVEILQLTDEQLARLEAGTGTLYLREDQVDIVGGYATALLDDLERWLDEPRFREVEEILESMLAQREIELQSLIPVAQAIDDYITAMRGGESSAGVYTSLRVLSTEAATPIKSDDVTLDQRQVSTVVYTPKHSDYGDKDFDSGQVWDGTSGLRGETVGAAIPCTGALAAYCDAGPFGGAEVCVSQLIRITVPNSNTDITITATILHSTATIGTPAPLPIAGGSASILTVSPSSGTGAEWSYQTVDSWFDWYDLGSWLLTIGSLGAGAKVQTAKDAVKALNSISDIVGYKTALEHRGEKDVLICSATSLPAGTYSFEIGLSARASATMGYASAFAFGAVTEIRVTQDSTGGDPVSPQYAPMIDAADRNTVGLRSDGTAVAVGHKHYGQCDVGDWTSIVQVAAGDHHTVGLKSDGTVIAVGHNYHGQCEVDGWKDIVQVDAGRNHTVGLKSDGTVVAVGCWLYRKKDVGDWRSIVQVAAGRHHTVGLKSDGTVVAVGWEDQRCDVDDWSSIVQVAAGWYHTVGLRSDGTVVAVGSNRSGQCDVSDWTSTVQVAAGSAHTVGLRSDGTVAAVGSNRSGQCDVSDWRLS